MVDLHKTSIRSNSRWELGDCLEGHVFPELQAGSSGRGWQKIVFLSTSFPSCSPTCECFVPSGDIISLVLMQYLASYCAVRSGFVKVFSLSVSIEWISCCFNICRVGFWPANFSVCFAWAGKSGCAWAGCRAVGLISDLLLHGHCTDLENSRMV